MVPTPAEGRPVTEAGVLSCPEGTVDSKNGPPFPSVVLGKIRAGRLLSDAKLGEDAVQHLFVDVFPGDLAQRRQYGA